MQLSTVFLCHLHSFAQRLYSLNYLHSFNVPPFPRSPPLCRYVFDRLSSPAITQEAPLNPDYRTKQRSRIGFSQVINQANLSVVNLLSGNGYRMNLARNIPQRRADITSTSAMLAHGVRSHQDIWADSPAQLLTTVASPPSAHHEEVEGTGRFH